MSKLSRIAPLILVGSIVGQGRAQSAQSLPDKPTPQDKPEILLGLPKPLPVPGIPDYGTFRILPPEPSTTEKLAHDHPVIAANVKKLREYADKSHVRLGAPHRRHPL